MKKLYSTGRLIVAHPMISGSAVMVGGSMAANAVNYVYHFIMGRTLGVADYGNLASLYSLLYILSIVPISSSISIVKFISSSKTLKDQSAVYSGVKNLVFRISFFSSLFILAMSPFIEKFLHIGNTASVALIAPILFFSLLNLVNQSTLQGMMNFFGVVVPNFVVSVIKLAIGLLLVLAGFGVVGAMSGVAISAIVGYLVSKFMIKRSNIKSTKPKLDTKAFLLYSCPVLLQALAFTAFFSVDVILVKHFFSAQEAGLYAALSTLGKIIYFAAQPITGVMFPIISKRHAIGEKYTKVLVASLVYTLGICVFALTVFLFLPKLALLLYGDQYNAAADKLVWMGLFISIYTVASLLTNFFLSIGKTKIVILPISFSLIQIVAIWIFHNSLLEVIQISLTLMLVLVLALFSYLLYNSTNLGYAKASK